MRLNWNCLDRANLPSCVFDETSSLLCYSSPIGVKVVNAATGKLVRVYGKNEQGDFFLQLALIQQEPKKNAQMQAKSAASAVENLPDPLIICSAYKRIRFYTFSRREPSETELDKVGRDLMNERLSNALTNQ